MKSFVFLRSARAGCLRAKFRAVCALRGVLNWYLRESRYLSGLPRVYREIHTDLRTVSFFLLKHLPRPRPWPYYPHAPADLDTLVQRQYGWHNPTHGNRRRHHHAAQ